MGSTGIQPSTVTGKGPSWNFAPDGTIDLRTQNVDHRQRYSRNRDQRDGYGYTTNAGQQPYDNFMAAVTADRDRVVAGSKSGTAMTFSWTAPDHRTDGEWKWQVPVGGALGLATFATTATLLSALTRPGAAARALAPGAFWGVALLSGLAVGAGSFLALQHWFDGRHHDFHVPAAPSGTVAAATAARLPDVPDNVRKLAGTKAWGAADDDSAVFGEPVGDLRGYDTRDAALKDMRGTMTVAAVRGSNDRTYLVQLRTDPASQDSYYAPPAGIPARDLGLPFISRSPQLDYYLTAKNVDAKAVQAEIARSFPNLSSDVVGIEYSTSRDQYGDAASKPVAPIGIDVDHGAGAPTFRVRKRDGRASEPVDLSYDHLLVGRWGQDAKTTGDGSGGGSSYYGIEARDNEVIAGTDIGPGSGYATREEALGDIAARPGDQAVFERDGRFHVYNTQDGAVLSGHDMVGLATVADHGGTTDRYYEDRGTSWDTRKAGTVVALEEFGITMLPHQGWWMTPGTVQPAPKPKAS